MYTYLSLHRYAAIALLTIAAVAVVIAIDRYKHRPEAQPSLLFAKGFLIAAGVWIIGWSLVWLRDLLPTWEMDGVLEQLVVRVLPLLGAILRTLGYLAMPATWLAFSLTSPDYERRASPEVVQWLMLIPAALAFFSVVRDTLFWAGSAYESLAYRYTWALRALGLLTRVYVLGALAAGIAVRWWRRGSGVAT